MALLDRKALREGFVIIASILIAFSLDAAWGNHQEAEAEKRILSELLDEFEMSRARVESSIEELEAVLGVSVKMLNHIGPDAPPLSSDSAQSLLGGILKLNTLEVPQSVLNSAISSGQLRLIRNREIRQRVAEWPALVEDVRENHEWHRVETDERLIPMVAPYIAVRSAINSKFESALSAGEWLGDSSLELDAGPLQRLPEFEALLAWRVNRQVATVVESRVLLQATDGVIQAIRAELGLGGGDS